MLTICLKVHISHFQYGQISVKTRPGHVKCACLLGVWTLETLSGNEDVHAVVVKNVAFFPV